MLGYLEELELGEQDLYDAQGNSFDPQAILVRMQRGVLGWARGEELARHEFPSASAVTEAYASVLEYVRARGLVGADHPFPHDLREWLLTLETGSQLSQTPGVVPEAERLRPAAEYGRGNL